jgi:hypothetical protein
MKKRREEPFFVRDWNCRAEDITLHAVNLAFGHFYGKEQFAVDVGWMQTEETKTS